MDNLVIVVLMFDNVSKKFESNINTQSVKLSEDSTVGINSVGGEFLFKMRQHDFGSIGLSENKMAFYIDYEEKYQNNDEELLNEMKDLLIEKFQKKVDVLNLLNEDMKKADIKINKNI